MPAILVVLFIAIPIAELAIIIQVGQWIGVWPTIALTHAAYVQRQDLQAAIGFDEAGPMDAIALAWLVEAADGHRPMILQKSGGLAGFMSYIAFAPGRDVGAFVSVNRIDFAMFAGLTEGVNELIAMLAPR